MPRLTEHTSTSANSQQSNVSDERYAGMRVQGSLATTQQLRLPSVLVLSTLIAALAIGAFGGVYILVMLVAGAAAGYSLSGSV